MAPRTWLTNARPNQVYLVAEAGAAPVPTATGIEHGEASNRDLHFEDIDPDSRTGITRNSSTTGRDDLRSRCG